MKLKGTLTFEYDTGTNEQTLDAYGSIDPMVVSDIDADAILSDPPCIVDFLGDGCTWDLVVEAA